MLIGGDDISNDFITLGTCLHSLSLPLRADRQKSDSSVDGDPQGSWRWNSNCRDVAASSLSFSRPTARAPWSAWLKNCSDVWTRVHQCRTWRLLEVGHPNYTMHLLPYCGRKQAVLFFEASASPSGLVSFSSFYETRIFLALFSLDTLTCRCHDLFRNNCFLVKMCTSVQQRKKD